MTDVAERASAIVLRPTVARLYREIVVVALLIALPPITALLWLSRDRAYWPGALAVSVVTVVLGLGLAAGVRRASVRVTASGFSETGFFGLRTEVSRTDVASILLVRVAYASNLDGYEQVFVLDARGRTLLRLRGQYWSAASLAAVLDSIDAPVERSPHTISVSDLRRLHGRKLYWIERHPVLTVLAEIAIASAATIPLMYFIVHATV